MSTRQPHIPITVSLRRLLPRASFVGCADIRVVSACEHSATCQPQDLFAAIRGSRNDGTAFVSEALKRGAGAILIDRPLTNVPVPQCIVPQPREAYSILCHALAGHPSRCLNVAGMTGTNGKTTVAWLIRSIMKSVGRATGMLGTIEYDDGRHNQTATLTTPDSKTLASWMKQMVQNGTSHAAIELSSHALEQGRVCGVQLSAAVVTNITQDHFDYHQNHEAYLAAKSQILRHLRPGGVIVLNADDAGSHSLADKVAGQSNVITFGMERSADITAAVIEESTFGSRFVLNMMGDEVAVTSRLVGRHNIANCLAAAAVAQSWGASLDEIATGIAELTSVPGRLERIQCGQPFQVFVDYAHTDDALSRCIRHLRTLTARRVICVFGAGGDRDRTKRPLLGRAAAEADVAVVTSDNPRTENPQTIIDEIIPGMHESSCREHVEVDRARAIRWAIEEALPDDVVLIAGKGHETEQIIGTDRIHFDDREEVRRCLKQLTNVPEPGPLQLRA